MFAFTLLEAFFIIDNDNDLYIGCQVEMKETYVFLYCNTGLLLYRLLELFT